MNLMGYFGNVQSHYFKKVMFELVKERYQSNEPIIEKLSTTLSSEKEVKEFFKLATDLYEIGYLKSVEDHREQLKKLGLNARITQGTQESKEG